MHCDSGIVPLTLTTPSAGGSGLFACRLKSALLAASCAALAWSSIYGLAEPRAQADDTPAPPAKAPAAPTLSARDRQKAATLIAAFQKARGKADKRDRIVEQILEIGGPATNQLLSVIEKEVSGQSHAYALKFQKRAATLSRGKTDKIDLAEVARLRAKVLDLKTQADLDKESIVRVADPAVERLGELFVFDRQDVLNKSPELRPDRTRLLALGRYWEIVSAALAAQLAAAKPAEADLLADADKAPSFENYLQGEEEMAAELAMPMDDGTRAVLAANAELAPKIDPEEARAILGCNLLRNLLGLAPLAIDLQLCAAGRDHAQDMESLKFFAHDSPVTGKADPWIRAQLRHDLVGRKHFPGQHRRQPRQPGLVPQPGPLQEHARRPHPHRRRAQRGLLHRDVRQVAGFRG